MVKSVPGGNPRPNAYKADALPFKLTSLAILISFFISPQMDTKYPKSLSRILKQRDLIQPLCFICFSLQGVSMITSDGEKHLSSYTV
jgi:hypothetical protein